MDGVVGEIEVEGLVCFYGLADCCFGFDRQGFGQEGIASVVFFQMGHGALFSSGAETVILLRVVAAGGSKGCPCDIDIETEICWVGAFEFTRAEMGFAYVYCVVAVVAPICPVVLYRLVLGLASSSLAVHWDRRCPCPG